MLGRNPVRHSEFRKDGKIQVAAIFYTLQGEGPYAGHPAVFIRLTGCNLRCTFCDTAWDDETDRYMSMDEITRAVDEVRPPGCNLFVVTGGEPLRQDMKFLVPTLLGLAPRAIVQFETAGTLWQPILLHDDVYFVVSPKTPIIAPEIWRNAMAFKYIIRNGQTDEVDGLPTGSTQLTGKPSRIARPNPAVKVYLSPCDELRLDDTKANEREVVRLAMKHGYIAGMQLHKLWGVQ